jgi:hypothetical protein
MKLNTVSIEEVDDEELKAGKIFENIQTASFAPPITDN